MNVSALAHRCGISRSTVLYYESIGLLQPARRTAAGYRHYGSGEVQRLRAICDYRAAGLRIEDIRQLLDGKAASTAEAVLRRRFAELGDEIAKLREHQQSILKLMNASYDRRSAMSKDKWVEIMRGAGFNDEDMHRWHAVFEQQAPADHEKFLEFLELPVTQIGQIRQWSRERPNSPPAA